jgi:type IV secretory pathway VirB10-like protein
MTDSELTPMVDDPSVSEALRGDLGVAKAATVQGFDTAAGMSALQASLAAEAGATAAAGGTSILTKVMLGAVVIGGATVAWVAARPSSPAQESVPPAAVEAVAEAEARPSKPEPKVEAPAPTPEEAPVLHVEEDVEADEPASPDVRSRGRRRSPRRIESKPAETAEQRLLREAERVADARKALSSDPARALKLAREAAEDFPRGQLIEEREALRIRALAQLGRRAEAEAAAERYLKRHPRGPHADAVRRATRRP